MSARRDRANHRLNERQILETARAAISLHDLLDGTTEVDVDELRLKDIGNQARRLAHCERIRPEDLNSNRTFVCAEPKLVQRVSVLTADSLRGQKLGDDYVRTKATAESPERRLRHSSHRSEVERYVVAYCEWKTHIN